VHGGKSEKTSWPRCHGAQVRTPLQGTTLLFCNFATQGIKGRGLQKLCDVFEVNFIIWLNWSAVERRILSGSVRGPNLAKQTAEMDRSRIDLRQWFPIYCTK